MLDHGPEANATAGRTRAAAAWPACLLLVLATGCAGDPADRTRRAGAGQPAGGSSDAGARLVGVREPVGEITVETAPVRVESADASSPPRRPPATTPAPPPPPTLVKRRLPPRPPAPPWPAEEDAPPRKEAERPPAPPGGAPRAVPPRPPPPPAPVVRPHDKP